VWQGHPLAKRPPLDRTPRDCDGCDPLPLGQERSPVPRETTTTARRSAPTPRAACAQARLPYRAAFADRGGTNGPPLPSTSTARHAQGRWSNNNRPGLHSGDPRVVPPGEEPVQGSAPSRNEQCADLLARQGGRGLGDDLGALLECFLWRRSFSGAAPAWPCARRTRRTSWKIHQARRAAWRKSLQDQGGSRVEKRARIDGPHQGVPRRRTGARSLNHISLPRT
jgi:hypothetical protein